MEALFKSPVPMLVVPVAIGGRVIHGGSIHRANPHKLARTIPSNIIPDGSSAGRLAVRLPYVLPNSVNQDSFWQAVLLETRRSSGELVSSSSHSQGYSLSA